MVEKKHNFDDEKSVADLLGTLPRVEAPGNFDIGVRKRIANGRPSSRSAWLLPSAAAVSFCSLVLAAVAFVYLVGSDEQVADLGQPEPAPIAVAETPDPQFTAAIDPVPANIQPDLRNAQTVSTASERTNASATRRVYPSTDRGGSYVDRALRQSEAPIVPFGTVPGPTPEANIRPPGPIVKVSAREILQLIGLDADFRNGGWVVENVAANSAAAKSGLRSGDIVEAIDNTKIGSETTFEGGFNGKSLTVVRDGTRQTINLRN